MMTLMVSSIIEKIGMDLKEFSLDLRKFHWIQENHGWEGKEPVHTEAVAV